MRTLTLVLAGCTLAAVVTLQARSGASDPAWNSAAAAQYLDARMDLWWAKAKPLKTGDGQARCLSCHTAIPYAMAMPALRKMSGTTTPTAHETRILETVRARVEHAGDQQPFYDFDEPKKVESRGTEAVINAFLMTTADAAAGSAAPSATTRTAMARMWEVQRADGAWDWLNFGLEPYETSDALFHGATLAAMAAGSPGGMADSATDGGKAGSEKLRGFLRANLASQRLFNRAWTLLAAARLRDVLSTNERAAIVADSTKAQGADGGWALTELGPWRWSKSAAPFAAPGTTDTSMLGQSDAYATGLVVYALKQSGLTIEARAVSRGVSWLVSHQQGVRADDPAWAPWRAHSLNFDREHGGEKGEAWRRMFMSDLATAFAVLALQ